MDHKTRAEAQETTSGKIGGVNGISDGAAEIAEGRAVAPSAFTHDVSILQTGEGSIVSSRALQCRVLGAELRA